MKEWTQSNVRQAESSLDERVNNFAWWDMFKAFWYFLHQYRWKYLLLSVVVIFAYAYIFIPPYVVGKVVEFFVGYHPGDSLRPFFVLVGGLTAITAVVNLLRQLTRQGMAKLNIDATYNARLEGFERLMEFSYEWHQSENSGVRVQRIMTGVSDLRVFGRTLQRELLQNSVYLLGTLGVFALVDWSLAIFFVVYLAITISVELFYYRRTHQVNNQTNAASEKVSGTYYESASNVLTVKALGAQEGVKQVVARSEANAREKSYQSMLLNTGKYRVYQVLGAVGLGIFLLLLGRQIVHGVIAVPFIVTYYAYYNRLQQSSIDFSDMITDLIDLKTGIARMMPIFWDTPQEEGNRSVPKAWEEIRFEEVGFEYPTEGNEGRTALQGITMTLGRNQKVGIVGRSGGGKSTMAKLLLSVYRPTHGKITIGDTNLAEIKHAERTQHISAVLQETELFSLSLRENITLFRKENTERLNQAIRVAQLEELVAKLPEGLETQVGEKGYKLSGGERQRLGIARAIYSDAEVIVMDEATSALDSTTEVHVQEAIEKELGDRTIIMIAHRLSTLRHADVIHVVDHGKLVESGSFDELMAKPEGAFKTLYDLQSRNPEAVL